MTNDEAAESGDHDKGSSGIGVISSLLHQLSRGSEMKTSG
jgi:hypothetical protein